MIFISSSYVFDGEKGNYLENDIPNSLNQCAVSKIHAEKKVLELKIYLMVLLSQKKVKTAGLKQK